MAVDPALLNHKVVVRRDFLPVAVVHRNNLFQLEAFFAGRRSLLDTLALAVAAPAARSNSHPLHVPRDSAARVADWKEFAGIPDLLMVDNEAAVLGMLVCDLRLV